MRKEKNQNPSKKKKNENFEKEKKQENGLIWENKQRGKGQMSEY